MDPLVDYIKENIKKYPENNLKLALIKEGYSSQEIDKAFQHAKKPTLQKESLGFFMAIMLALIYFVVVAIWPILFLIILVYSQQLIVYGLILFSAFFLGWLCSAVVQKTTKRASLRIFSGIMIAAIPTEIIILVLSIWSFLGSIIGYLAQIGGGEIPVTMSPILAVEITTAEVLVLSLMFFIAFNLVFLFSSIKEEKKGILALYILAPVVYIGIWYLVKFVLNRYLLQILPTV